MWVSDHPNEVWWSRSHYGPTYCKDLSVTLEAGEPKYVDYYFKFGGKLLDKVTKYPLEEKDILLRYDIREKKYYLLHPKKKG